MYVILPVLPFQPILPILYPILYPIIAYYTMKHTLVYAVSTVFNGVKNVGWYVASKIINLA